MRCTSMYKLRTHKEIKESLKKKGGGGLKDKKGTTTTTTAKKKKDRGAESKGQERRCNLIFNKVQVRKWCRKIDNIEHKTRKEVVLN